MDTTAVKMFFTSSGLSSTGPENQKLFDDAIANLPISFGEGIDIAGYSDHIQRYAVRATGQELFPLQSLSGILHNSEHLDLLAPFLLPPSRRSESTLTLAQCLRKHSAVAAFAQTFCDGDTARAHTRVQSDDLSGLPERYVLPTSPAARTVPTIPIPADTASSPSPHPARRLDRTPTTPDSPQRGLAPTAEGDPTGYGLAEALADLAASFPGKTTYETDITALLILLGAADYARGATPTLDELGLLLDTLPGALFVRIASMLRVDIPDLTKQSHSGWGPSKRKTLVVIPLQRKIFAVLRAYSVCRAATAFTTPPPSHTPPPAAFGAVVTPPAYASPSYPSVVSYGSGPRPHESYRDSQARLDMQARVKRMLEKRHSQFRGTFQYLHSLGCFPSQFASPDCLPPSTP